MNPISLFFGTGFRAMMRSVVTGLMLSFPSDTMAQNCAPRDDVTKNLVDNYAKLWFPLVCKKRLAIKF
ncbi:hypothetical protein RA28_16450 [Ruegeria sp. ANG-S4]|uniref:hypothetical protein n=1 Tax=Ruegeria sp. ANG-S4 TaxID=1577904 RepID=UPI00057D3406|nr:hypothetical protein [Ruegeria sp. ANG-S4]KIC44496.1 hypothetical protein RA28_16450 [Ruegeria sp. ANG-S4]